jgi:hypothetical protein
MPFDRKIPTTTSDAVPLQFQPGVQVETTRSGRLKLQAANSESRSASRNHPTLKENVSVDVSGLSSKIPLHSLEFYLRHSLYTSEDDRDAKNVAKRLHFGNRITLKASCINCISRSCKDEPVRDLAKGIREMASASPTVYVQLDCIVYGLTYCSFGEFSWSDLDDALVKFTAGHVQVNVLVRFPRENFTSSQGGKRQTIAFTPPGFLDELMPRSMSHPNISIITEPPTIVVDPDMMYYNSDLSS